jgi:hypothetical protein
MVRLALESSLRHMTVADCGALEARLTRIRKWISPSDSSPNFQSALKQHRTDSGFQSFETEKLLAANMEPLSIVTGVTTLAGAAKGVNLICTFRYHAMPQAPEELRALKDELDLFAGYLEDVSQLPQSTNLSSLRLQHHSFKAHRTLDQVLEVFQRVSSPYCAMDSTQSGQSKFKPLIWARPGPQAKNLRARLRTLKDDINAEIALVAL